MHTIDAQAPPEQLMAELNRRRHWKMLGAIGGLVLAVGAAFAIALAIYSDDPAASSSSPSSSSMSLTPAPAPTVAGH